MSKIATYCVNCKQFIENYHADGGSNLKTTGPVLPGGYCSSDADCAPSPPVFGRPTTHVSCENLGRGNRCIGYPMSCRGGCAPGYWCCLGNDGYHCRECKGISPPCLYSCESTCANWRPAHDGPPGPETCADS